MCGFWFWVCVWVRVRTAAREKPVWFYFPVKESWRKISAFHTGTEYTPILVCIHIYVYGYVNRCKRLQRLKTAIYRRHNNLHFVTVSEKSNWATETGRCDEDRVHGIGLTSTQHTPRNVLEWLASPPPSRHPTIPPPHHHHRTCPSHCLPVRLSVGCVFIHFHD